MEFALHVVIHADERADVRGMVVLRGDRPPTVLVAEGSGATATCADTDRDGLVGLSSLTVGFRHARTGVTMRGTFVPANDIEASGTYTIAVRGLTSSELAVEAQVRLAGKGFGFITPEREE